MSLLLLATPLLSHISFDDVSTVAGVLALVGFPVIACIMLKNVFKKFTELGLTKRRS